MKRLIITIVIAIPTQALSSVGSEIIMVAEEGSGFFGFILAGLFGYIIGYPLLLCVFLIKYSFLHNKCIMEKSRKSASMLLDNFVQKFLLIFVFILPFALIFPALLFSVWVEKISFISIYVIYTAISLLIATVWALRTESI